MESSSKIVRSKQELRLNKLKNKKTQLENLLRARARLDFEIKTLKKSIAKDQKKVQKEEAVLQRVSNSGSLEVISENVQLEDNEDELQAYHESVENLQHESDELNQIFELLLHYDENPN